MIELAWFDVAIVFVAGVAVGFMLGHIAGKHSPRI